MTQTVLREKILGLQAEMESIKRAITKRPGFTIDEENWRRIRTEAKKIRKKLYKTAYGKR